MTHTPTSPRLRWTWAPLLLLAACGPAPVINSFTATPDHIPYGDTAHLAWDVKDATSVTLEGVGPVQEGVTTQDVTPHQTSTYTLTAQNTWGKTSAQVTVTLVPKLSMAGGTYNGASLGLTVAALLRDPTGAPPTTDTTVIITPPSNASPNAPLTITCPGGRPLCLAMFPTVTPVKGTYQASATVSGTAITTSFTVTPTTRLPQAAPISVAQEGSQTLVANWQPVDGATSYRAQPYDFTNNAPFGQALVVSGLSASLTTSSPMSSGGQYGVLLEASALDFNQDTAPATLPAPNVSRALGHIGGTPDGWQYFDPSRWSGNTLQVSFSGFNTSEHLAVLVINAGGRENAAAQLSVSGTFSLPAPLAPQARMMALPGADTVGLEPALRTPAALHEREREEEALILEQLKAGRPPAASAAGMPTSGYTLPAPAPSNTSFCVRQGIGSPATYVRKTATLKLETTHAVIYVDDSDLAQYTAQEPGIWNTLGNLWESKIYPGDTGTFGAESDVDANGKLIVLFSGELGKPQSTGILLGYFTANDTYYSQDTTATCGAATGKGSNHADMFYLNSLANVTAAGASATDAINRIYPDTLAHEFQHLINFNQHVLVRNATALEDTWINEGLSMVAEEIGGYGWNSSDGRTSGASYMDRLTGANLSYNSRSLTVWESDPIGNYEGAHSFFRYYADRYGTPVLSALVQTDLVGANNLASALGLPFARAYAEWTTAVMFSNESFSPAAGQFDFKGSNWAPLHQQLRYLNYVSLNPSSPQSLTLRKDGWNAFLTGSGLGGTATITLTSSETVKPTVVVVRFSGSLPRQ